MTREEAQRILAMLRAGERDTGDPFFADALKQAESDPELARWLAAEQEFDRLFIGKLGEVLPPAGLRTRIIASAGLRSEARSRWLRAAALAAAAIILLAFAVGILRSRGQLLDEFRGEMISFVKLPLPLELETASLDGIEKFLTNAKAPTPADATIPPGLRALDPAGCRVLYFRGRKVTLICFKRGNGRLAHLFVLDRAALPRLGARSRPTFAGEGEWMTAAWQENGKAYVLTAQGDRTLLERYLHGS